MRKLIILGSLVLGCTPALAGFTINSSPNAFTFQWFEPAWSGSEAVGFGNGTLSPGASTNFQNDAVYQWTHWYRANVVDGSSQSRNYQIVKFTDQFINGPNDVTNWAYETAPGIQPAIRWEFRTKLVGVSSNQCYIRVDWTAKDAQKDTTRSMDVNFFPYLDLQTQTASPGVDSVTYNSSTQSFTQTSSNPTAPVLYVRAFGCPLDSFQAGNYSPLRSNLASTSFSQGLNNFVQGSSGDIATAFCHRFRLEPGAAVTGSYAVGYNILPPIPARVTGQVSLDQFGASSVGMPITVKICDPATGNVLETTAAYLGTNGSFAVNTDVTLSSVDVKLKVPKGLTAKIAGVNLSAGNASSIGSRSLRNGDVDGDDIVSILDYLVLSEKFGTTAGLFFDARPDLDGDGEVSILDYIILSENFDQEGQQ